MEEGVMAPGLLGTLQSVGAVAIDSPLINPWDLDGQPT